MSGPDRINLGSAHNKRNKELGIKNNARFHQSRLTLISVQLILRLILVLKIEKNEE